MKLTVERVAEPGLHLYGAPPQRSRAIRDRASALLSGLGTGIQARGFKVTIEPALVAGRTPGLAHAIAAIVLASANREREEGAA